MDLPEITDVKRLALRPGDRLVLRLDHEPTYDEFDEIKEHVARFAGPDVPVLVLGPDMDIEVIGPPEPDGA